MKKAPKSANFETKQMKRVDFMSGALRRLQDDVGTTLELVEKCNYETFSNNKRTIGYWSSLRMILPIIEAVSYVMETSPQCLLGNYLNITTPNLMWDLFRHSLIHGDTLHEGVYKGKRVTWAVGFGAGGHVIKSGYIAIDIATLYQDLVNFLQKEIKNNDETLVDIEVGVIYGVKGDPNPFIISDFFKL